MTCSFFRVALSRSSVILIRARAPILCRYSSTSLRLPDLDASVPALVGSAPNYSRHLILHTQHPVASWPSRIETVSPLLQTLSAKWRNDERMNTLGLTFAEDTRASGISWNIDQTTSQSQLQEEVYSGFIYPDFIPVPALSLSTIFAFEEFFLALPPPSTPLTLSNSADHPPSSSSRQAHIYVCTHASRDCRCGDIGTPFYDALKKESRRKGIEEDELRILRIAHIGGHKWAANALLYRNEDRGADWFGQLRATDSSEFLTHALSSDSAPLLEFWRGRLGLSPASARALYLDSIASLPIDSTNGKSKKKAKVKSELGDPVTLTFVTYDEEVITAVGYEGETLMEVGVRNDFETIQAQCGGHCECATCHIHLIPPDLPIHEAASNGRIPIAVPIAVLPPVSEEEEDQLEFAMGRRDDSRLSCQINVTKELTSWTIELPRY